MITKRQLSYFEIPPMVLSFYTKDGKFLSKYHRLAEEGSETCIKDTTNLLLTENLVYGIFNDDKLIAYFSHNFKINTPCLGGFFVDVDYRNSQFLTTFCEMIKDSFTTNFISCIYNKNLPALNFIERAGGKLVDKTDKYTLFVFEK